MTMILSPADEFWGKYYVVFNGISQKKIAQNHLQELVSRKYDLLQNEMYMMLLLCKFMNYLQVTNKLLVMIQVSQNQVFPVQTTQSFFCLTLTCKTIQWVDSLVLLFSVF